MCIDFISESYDYSEDFEEKAESESEGKVSSEVTVKAQPDVPKPVCTNFIVCVLVTVNSSK